MFVNISLEYLKLAPNCTLEPLYYQSWGTLQEVLVFIRNFLVARGVEDVVCISLGKKRAWGSCNCSVQRMLSGSLAFLSYVWACVQAICVG